MPSVHRFRFAAVVACVLLSTSCGSGALPAGGMANTVSATSASSSSGAAGVAAGGPGFLTPTPPEGGGGAPVTPPPGGIGPTATPTAAPASSVARATSLTSSSVTRPRATASAIVSATPTPYETPTPQATDTPVPVASVSGAAAIQVAMPTPPNVKPGGSATVQATTTVPGAVCTLTVRYRTGGSAIPQFPVETADANGAISWTWTVAPDVVPGDWPVTVRCQVGLPLGDSDLPFAFATNLLSIR